MTNEYYYGVFKILAEVRDELVNDLLQIEDAAEGLALVSDIKSTNRVLSRLLILKERAKIERETLTLKGDS